MFGVRAYTYVCHVHVSGVCVRVCVCACASGWKEQQDLCIHGDPGHMVIDLIQAGLLFWTMRKDMRIPRALGTCRLRSSPSLPVCLQIFSSPGAAGLSLGDGIDHY